MMKLYHCKTARSLRPLWMLEELGLDYELTVLPFPPRVFQKEYLAVNPLGTIPAFFDGDLRMTESAGICHYLYERYAVPAGRTDLGVRVHEPEYGRFLNWLYYSDATLTFPQAIFLRYTQLEPPERRSEQAAADYRAFFNGRMKLVEEALRDGAEYLCAGRFTAADIAVGFGLHLAMTLRIDDKFSPAAHAYMERLAARPAFQRAIAK